MKSALLTLSLIATSLLLLFGMSKTAWSDQAVAESGWHAGHWSAQRQSPASTRNTLPSTTPPVHPAEMQELKAALERNREELA